MIDAAVAELAQAAAPDGIFRTGRVIQVLFHVPTIRRRYPVEGDTYASATYFGPTLREALNNILWSLGRLPELCFADVAENFGVRVWERRATGNLHMATITDGLTADEVNFGLSRLTQEERCG